MKKILALILAMVMTLALFAGCSKKEEEKEEESKAPVEEKEEKEEEKEEAPERMSITMAGLAGGMQSFPAYIANEKGFFDEVNLDCEIIYFESGPVQMESLISGAWDVAATGIGGVLAGAIAYDAVVIASPHSDYGTQYFFARNDSAIAQAGQGNSTTDPSIYGSAEAFKGSKILCQAGTVLQYLLIKTLDGFGLTVDDVEFVSMDTSTTNSAFLSGEGDAACITGVNSFDEDKKDFTIVSTGKSAQTGLACNVMASEEAIAEKHDEVAAFLKGYFMALDWIMNNKDEAVDSLVTFCDISGKSTTKEVAEIFIYSEDFYDLAENYRLLTEKAEGSDLCIMEQRSLDVLNFYIDAGNYMAGDDERFVGHIDTSFVEELYAASK